MWAKERATYLQKVGIIMLSHQTGNHERCIGARVAAPGYTHVARSMHRLIGLEIGDSSVGDHITRAPNVVRENASEVLSEGPE